MVSEHEEKNQNVVGKKDQNNEDILIKLREEMNIKQKEIETNYRQLKMKVVKGPGEEDFQDHRVKDLWKRAKAQILSEDELAVMKVSIPCFFFLRLVSSEFLKYCFLNVLPVLSRFVENKR